MDVAGVVQDNSHPINIYHDGGNFTDVKGDIHHYHIRGTPELGRGELLSS